MTPSSRERASLAHDLTAIYLAHHARENPLHDHLAGVVGILLAGLVGLGPWVLMAVIWWNG